MSTIGKRRSAKAKRPVSLPSAKKVETEHVVRPSSYFRWKNVLDRVLAAVLLIPALPVIGLLVLLVRLTSPGPGLFRQLRVGKSGRAFTMYKLRSMATNAEAATGAVWSQEDDPRVTRFGRLLRTFHLDELPQLLHVLKGEMSLVGPRPERPEFVHVLAAQIPGYLNRLAVLPGVTGLAQLNLPPDSDLNSVRRKLVLDLEYVEHAGLFLDVRLLACTFARLLKIPAIRPLGLQRSVPAFDHDKPFVSGGNGSAGERTSPVPVPDQLSSDHPATNTRMPGNGRPHRASSAEGDHRPRPR
jgi:lipopolysaccharide/colanic/teichoic acid biosynthesis glycosyltransferase